MDEIKLDTYVATIEQDGDGWFGQVILRSERDYCGSAEWMLRGTNKLEVVTATIDALMFYEHEANEEAS